MRFMIDKKYIDSTKRNLEELGYSFSAFSATASEYEKAVVMTDAGEPECHAAVCRAFLESVKPDENFILITAEEMENPRVKTKLARLTGIKVFSVYGTQKNILPGTGFEIL